MNKPDYSTRYCTRCGCAYPAAQGCCPERKCGCPEFSNVPNEATPRWQKKADRRAKHLEGAVYEVIVCPGTRHGGVWHAKIFRVDKKPIDSGLVPLYHGPDLVQATEMANAYNLKLTAARRKARRRLQQANELKPAPAFKSYAEQLKKQAAEVVERAEAGEIVEVK